MHLFKVSKRKKLDLDDTSNILLGKFNPNARLFVSQKLKENKHQTPAYLHEKCYSEFLKDVFSFSVNKFHSMFSVNNAQNKSQKNITSLRTVLCVCGIRLASSCTSESPHVFGFLP